MTTWQRIFGNDSYEQGRFGIQSHDKGYIILSRKQNPNGILLLKLDEYGNPVWSKYYDTLGIGVIIQKTQDSGYIIAGTNNGRGALSKIDNKGNLLWTKNFAFQNQNSAFYSAKVIKNNDILLCGTYSFPAKAYFLRTNYLGNIIWEQAFFNSSSFTIAYDIIQTSDNFIYTVGAASISGHVKTIAGKLDLNGNIIWFKNYGTSGKGDSQDGTVIIQDSDIHLVVTGNYSTFFSSNSYFAKIDSSGKMMFQNILPHTNQVDYMAKTKSGNYGIIGGFLTQSDDISFCLVNNSGIILNDTLINSSIGEGDFTKSIVNTMDGGFLITGSTTFLDTISESNIYVIKTDSLGKTKPLGIQSTNTTVPFSFILHQNYPNPFNSSTKIRFGILKKSKINLEIFDVKGTHIITLVDKIIDEGFHEIVFEAKGLASGIYFYRISSLKDKDVKKMILLN